LRLLLSLLLILPVTATAAQANPRANKCSELSETTQSLITEYRGLRHRSRHLAPGKFDQDLNASGGRYSKVLHSLGEALGHAPFTSKTLEICLGKPDALRSQKQMGHLLSIYNRELEKSGRPVTSSDKRSYLIYFWRGWHDFIFFISEDGKIVDHGWWFAYE
jgi:hypothetical protein